MVAQAQRSRAPIQRLADQVSGWFVPTVILVSLIAFAAWSIWGPEPRVTFGLIAAVSVLIIACPCALGLATPMSIMVGVGRGAQSGVLIKNAEALERMEKVETLIGTLESGSAERVAVTMISSLSASSSAECAQTLPLITAVASTPQATRDIKIHLSLFICSTPCFPRPGA